MLIVNLPNETQINKTEEYINSIIDELNNQSNKIADDIDKDIKKVFPEDLDITTHTFIQFRIGSVELACTVLFTWLGSIILSEIENQISEVVKLVVQNVSSRFVRAAQDTVLNKFSDLEGQTIQESPRLSPVDINYTRANYNGVIRQSSEEIIETPTPTTLSGTVVRTPTTSEIVVRQPNWLLGWIIAITIVSILQLLILGQFITFKIEPKMGGTQPTSSVSPSP